MHRVSLSVYIIISHTNQKWDVVSLQHANVCELST